MAQVLISFPGIGAADGNYKTADYKIDGKDYNPIFNYLLKFRT